jgi:hypothetical protein
MPVVRGRYYINRVLGEALEGAREAEAALAALEQEREGQENSSDPQRDEKGPIRHVEIETAQVVPSYSGRGERGYVARVHRRANAPSGMGQPDDDPAANKDSYARAMEASAGNPPSVETRVFNNHQDLMNFLQDQFEKDHSE